jgi:integrase
LAPRSKRLYHLARFILLGLYTGTRREAILQLRWRANTSGGWIDLDRGVLYRKGEGEIETNKRRTPAPLADRLVPHLRRWRCFTQIGPTEYYGEQIKGNKNGWHSARVRAGLDESVAPHTMRHTCATWLLQKGVPTWEAAGIYVHQRKSLETHTGIIPLTTCAMRGGLFLGEEPGAFPDRIGDSEPAAPFQ